MLTRHYAPSLPLRLNALDKNQGEAMLGFGEMPCDLNLSRQKNLQEAASNLFRMMRLLDHSKYKGLAVAPIPFEGLGLAINDRLSRAAADGEEGARNDP
jgi:L-threonylcarbamoyladenylate synthase